MGWIVINKSSPTSGYLPARYDKVLISIDDDVHEAYRSGDVWYITTDSKYRGNVKSLADVDAWMQKPKPYKG